jgi:DNA-binding MarR family transcriptional regulator
VQDRGKRKKLTFQQIFYIIQKLTAQQVFTRRKDMLGRFARFSLAISEIDRCWHKLAAEEMAKYELNSPHAVYLNTLYEYPEGVTAAKLGELCCKNKADVSRMVAILEQKGLATKEAVGGNRYRAKLLLTPTGRYAAEQVRKKAAQVVELAGTGMSDEDREIFYRCLEQIAANLQTLSKDGLPTEQRGI